MKPAIQTIRHRPYNKLETVAVAYQPYIGRIASVLAIMCALSVFLYGVFLLEAVAQAAARTTAERQIHDLSSQLGVLEGDYLAATKTLTPERAESLGFVPPVDVSTVVVGGGNSLSFVGR